MSLDDHDMKRVVIALRVGGGGTSFGSQLPIVRRAIIEGVFDS